jgi:hypothetical protein
MRKKVDESELDEVFIEEDEPVAPLAPPKIAEGTTPSTSLPVISAPPAAPVVPPTLPPIPLVESPPVAPPSTIPFSPPPAVVDPIKPADDVKKDGPPLV